MYKFLIFRCLIPDCDDRTELTYQQDWLHNAIPGEFSNTNQFQPNQCLRYLRNGTVSTNSTSCPKSGFLIEVEQCDEWVFDNEKTIVNEVSIKLFL